MIFTQVDLKIGNSQGGAKSTASLCFSLTFLNGCKVRQDQKLLHSPLLFKQEK